MPSPPIYLNIKRRCNTCSGAMLGDAIQQPTELMGNIALPTYSKLVSSCSLQSHQRLSLEVLKCGSSQRATCNGQRIETDVQMPLIFHLRTSEGKCITCRFRFLVPNQGQQFGVIASFEITSPHGLYYLVSFCSLNWT